MTNATGDAPSTVEVDDVAAPIEDDGDEGDGVGDAGAAGSASRTTVPRCPSRTTVTRRAAGAAGAKKRRGTACVLSMATTAGGPLRTTVMRPTGWAG